MAALLKLKETTCEPCIFSGLAEGGALEQFHILPERRAAADGAVIMLGSALSLAQEMNP